jgi:transposase
VADYFKIMILVLEGRSYGEIVETVGCSRRDVSVVKKTVTARGISPGVAESMTDAELQALFPDGRRRVSEEYERPDYAAVLRSMKANRHFTLQQAWRKYVGADGQGKKYGYSQYCHLFGEHLRVNDLVATLQHEPGRAMLVDWAGDTIDLVDAVTASVTKAYLFVAVLPFSGVVFCHAYTTMQSPAWLDAHARAFSTFGGVTGLVVPDNPTTSTHQRKRGDAERVVNARYQQLADHYGTAVVPTRARKPRDKAAVESAVNVVNKRVIGYLAEDVWTTLGDLNSAIAERVREINHDIRRADGTTRWERFEAEEAPRLAPLPVDRFEEVEWKQLKVGRNYHITCDYQHYSVPHSLAGTLLRVRLTSSRVTVFDAADIVCEHPRLSGRKGQYSTQPEHVPAQHRDVDGLWSRRWFLDRARSYGPATVTVIEAILDRHAIEAQGYLDCRNILDGLGKRNRGRLEAACQELLNRRGHPTYTTLKRVMAAIDSDTKRPGPVTPAASTRKPTPSAAASHDVHVRDASHYARGGEGR